MNIKTYGHTVKVTTALKEHIEQQFNKIEKFSHLFGDVSVVLEVQNNSHTAKATVVVPHSNDIHATVSTDDMYNSIDDLSLKIEQQLRKIKSIHADVDRSTLISNDPVDDVDEENWDV